jgi:hypothetical protein
LLEFTHRLNQQGRWSKRKTGARGLGQGKFDVFFDVCYRSHLSHSAPNPYANIKKKIRETHSRRIDGRGHSLEIARRRRYGCAR